MNNQFWRHGSKSRAAGKSRHGEILSASDKVQDRKPMHPGREIPLLQIGLRPSYAAAWRDTPEADKPIVRIQANGGASVAPKRLEPGEAGIKPGPHTSTMPHGHPQPSKRIVVIRAKEVGAGTRGATIEPPTTSGFVPSQVAARGVGPVVYERRGR